MQYSDYQCFRFVFDCGVAFVSIDHPPINLLDEVLSQELDRLGRDLENDESVRVVVLQSALPDFFIAHSGLGRIGNASKMVSHTRSFRLTQTIGERPTMHSRTWWRSHPLDEQVHFHPSLKSLYLLIRL